MNEAEAKKKLEDAAIGIAIKHMHTREAGGAKAIVGAAVEYAQALLAAARVPVKGLTHHGPTMPHPGPSNQPLACALTADASLRRNTDSHTITEKGPSFWSALARTILAAHEVEGKNVPNS